MRKYSLMVGFLMARLLNRLNSDRFAVWAVPTFLLSVAAFHFVMVQLTDLTQWKGGGFGMFSTVDSGSNRWLRVYGIEADGAEHVMDVPRHLTVHERRVRSQPILSRTRRLGLLMLEGKWWADGEGEVNSRADGRRLPLEAIRIEVWKGRYVSAASRIDAEKLFEVTVDAGD